MYSITKRLDYIKALANTDVSVSQGECTFVAQDKVQMRAPRISAHGNILVYGVNGVTVQDDHDTAEQHTVEIGDGSRKESRRIDVKSRGCVFISTTGTVILKADYGNVEVTNIHIQTKKAVLQSAEGFVKILLGKNEYQYSEVEQWSDLFFQGGSTTQGEGTTYSAATLPDDTVIEAQGILIEQVRGQTLQFLEHLNIHGGAITSTFLDEFHKVETESYMIPTKAFAAVAAIAVTVATAGVGSAVGELLRR